MSAFQDETARERIPDPTALTTFEKSRLDWAEPRKEAHSRWLVRYRRLLEIRAGEIVPRLSGMPGFAGSYQMLGPKAVSVEWQLGDGSRLLLLANFSEEPVPVRGNSPVGRMVYSSAEPGAPRSATFFLVEPTCNEVGS
jgi:maltooligosyltrehalose trehalohydrolase